MPDPATVLVEGDMVRVSVAAADTRDRLDALLAEEAGREAPDEVLALTTLEAEPELRRLLGGQPGGSHTPVG